MFKWLGAQKERRQSFKKSVFCSSSNPLSPLASLGVATFGEAGWGCRKVATSFPSENLPSPRPTTRREPKPPRFPVSCGGGRRGEAGRGRGTATLCGRTRRTAFPVHRGGRGCGVSPPPPPVPFNVLNSAIDRKLQGQLNALRFRALVRPERLQTAPQSLVGLRRGDLWRPLTQKCPQGDHCARERAAPLRAAPTPSPAGGEDGLGDSKWRPGRCPLETRKPGGRWKPAAAGSGKRSPETVSEPSGDSEASAGDPIPRFLRICHAAPHPTPPHPRPTTLRFSLSTLIAALHPVQQQMLTETVPRLHIVRRSLSGEVVQPPPLTNKETEWRLVLDGLPASCMKTAPKDQK